MKHMMKRLFLGCFVIFSPLLALAAPPAPHASVAVPEVLITGNRVHLSDVVKNAPADMADIDLGAAPASGGSRIFDKGDLALALGDKADKVSLPNAIRIVRKMHKLGVHTFYRPRKWGDGEDAPEWGDPEATQESAKKLVEAAKKL